MRPVPADIGQRVALSLLQGQAVGIEDVTALLGDSKGELIAHLDVAVTRDLRRKEGAVFKLQIAVSRAAEPLHDQHLALELSIPTPALEKVFRAHPQGDGVALLALAGLNRNANGASTGQADSNRIGLSGTNLGL